MPHKIKRFFLLSFPHKNRAIVCLYIYLVLICMSFLSIASIGYLSTISVFTIELDSSIESEMTLYWADERSPFLEEKSKRIMTQKGKQNYWFFVKDFNRQTYFRITPANEKAILKIYSAKLYSFQYFPIKFDLLNDSVGTHGVEVINYPSLSRDYMELRSLGGDPKIEIRPIHTRMPFVILAMLVIIVVLLFRKKYIVYASFVLLGGLFLYHLLGLNEVQVVFSVKAGQAGEVKVFWRDSSEMFSNTRVRKVSTLSGIHQYQIKIGNINNVEVLYLESPKGTSQSTGEVTVSALGFEDFTFSGIEHIIKKQEKKEDLISSICLFFIVYGLAVWCVYIASIYRFFNADFFPALMRVLFFMSSLLVCNLAWQSNADIHPDEHAHIESIKYYNQYWEAPTIGDSRALTAYQVPWAFSRLDDLGISYFVAGKFSKTVGALFVDTTFTVRAFNVFLFTLFFILSRNKRLLLFLVPLLCTPQIWYLYSYANREGFVLFVCLLLAWQLVNKKGGLNIFLRGNRCWESWRNVIFSGVLLGVIGIEQTNYLLFIIFICLVLLWRLVFFEKYKKVFFYKCLFFIVIGISTFVLRYSVDVSVNGFHKQERRIAYAERHAEPAFKPSIATTKDSYPGLRLKSKGVSFEELFQPEWSWHEMTFKSFSGLYGYYAEYSPKWYYAYVLLIYTIIFLVLLRHAVFHESWRYNLFSVLSFITIGGGILMGVLFSWLHDFQPQGRYLFPIVPVMLVYFWIIFPRLDQLGRSTLLASVLTLALLSFYSFNEVALNYLTL